MSAAPAWRPDDFWGIFSLSELAEGGVDAYLQKVAEAAAAQFNASGASIFLSEDADGLFRVRARAGRQLTVPDSALIVRGEGVAGRIVSSGTARVLGDISTEPDLIDIAPLDRSSISSSLVVPLMGAEGAAIGVLNLSRHAGFPSFRADDLERARALAAMISLAVANVRLVEKLRLQAKESERLRRLAEIGQMTAAIAHEIRNPLTGIRSAAQVVKEDPELADEFMSLIEDEVLKLNDLCEEFLAFARPMELNLGESDLAQIVRGVCSRQMAEFQDSGVGLTVETASDIPTMNLDGRRVEQVVHNLVRNARQACRRGGSVLVEVTAGRLSVSDNGAGMTEEQLDRLFSPFFTTKPDGTGLGLCNVRRIVDAHGGSVSAESRKGVGTKFVVSFDGSEV